MMLLEGGMILEDEIRLIKSMETESAIWEDIEDAIDHGILVSNLAMMLSNELNMSKKFCSEIAIAGMLHDIGKLKLGKYLYGRHDDLLQIEEIKYVRMHPKLSYEVLKRRASYSENILMSIYHHHENLDGTGYPGNLKGDAIPYGAKVLRTCDVFAALISERPYRVAFDIDTTMELMIEEVKNFDMRIFLSFMNMIHSKEFNNTKEFINAINGRSKFRNKFA